MGKFLETYILPRLDSKAAAGKESSLAASREKLWEGCFASFLCTESWGNRVGKCSPAHQQFLPCLLQSGSEICKPDWLSELGVLGAHFLGGTLKTGGAKCEVQTFHSSGRSWYLGVSSWFFGTVMEAEFIGRVCLSLSYQFQHGSFPTCLMFRNHSASFWISFKENCCVSAVSVWNSAVSCVTILVDSIPYVMGFPGGSVVKNPPTMQETLEMQVWLLRWEDALEEEVTTHSTILAWKIP